MVLHGHTQLDLLRNGKIVHRVEHDNTITPFFTDCFNKSNRALMASRTLMLPLTNWFNGCLLTDKDNDASISMIAGDAEVVAQASNTAYTGTNLKRGSYNATESHDITNASGEVIGRTQVFDWSTSQGNGDIKSVCLTRASIGATHLYDDGVVRDDSAYVNEFFANREDGGTLVVNDVVYYTAKCQIIDFSTERAYYFTRDNSKVYLREFAVNGNSYHITGRILRNQITTREFAIPTNSGQHYPTVSYTGDYFHIFVNRWSGNNTLLDEYKIKLSDWSVTQVTHTLENVRLYNGYYDVFAKDVILIKDGYGYVYGQALVDGAWKWKMIVFSLTNDADITTLPYPNDPTGASGDSWYNGPSLLLPNGDFIKERCGPTTNNNNMTVGFFHNGNMYRVRCASYDMWGGIYYGLQGGDGFQFICSPGNDPNLVSFETLYPYVSTVNNLAQKVEKRSDLSMKLTYTLTET